LIQSRQRDLRLGLKEDLGEDVHLTSALRVLPLAFGEYNRTAIGQLAARAV
jgi:hypothetical protein